MANRITLVPEALLICLLAITACKDKFFEQSSLNEGKENARSFNDCQEDGKSPEAVSYVKSIAYYIAEKNQQRFSGELDISRFCFTVNSFTSRSEVSQRWVKIAGFHIQQAESDAELAFLISHELSHIVLGHGWDSLASRNHYQEFVALQKEIHRLRNSTEARYPDDEYEKAVNEVSPLFSQSNGTPETSEKQSEDEISSTKLETSTGMKVADGLHALAWELEISSLTTSLPSGSDWFLWDTNMVKFAVDALQRSPAAGKHSARINQITKDLENMVALGDSRINAQPRAKDFKELFGKAMMQHITTVQELLDAEEKLISLKADAIGGNRTYAMQADEVAADDLGMALYVTAGFLPQHAPNFIVKGAKNTQGKDLPLSCFDREPAERGNGPQYPDPCWRVWNIMRSVPVGEREKGLQFLPNHNAQTLQAAGSAAPSKSQ
jgi:hypothetical protein